MISSKKIRRLLKDAYPNMGNVWLRHKEYRPLTVDELIAFVEDNTPITGDAQCEIKATILHGKAKKRWSPKQVVFGECLVDKMLDRAVYHAMNFGITTNDKIWLVDPGSGGYWVANPKEDNIYFIFM